MLVLHITTRRDRDLAKTEAAPRPASTPAVPSAARSFFTRALTTGGTTR